jgi:hypothetical protein
MIMTHYFNDPTMYAEIEDEFEADDDKKDRILSKCFGNEF